VLSPALGGPAFFPPDRDAVRPPNTRPDNAPIWCVLWYGREMTRTPGELERRVAERLAAIMDERDMTQAWASRRLGRPPSWLGRKLRLETPFTLSDIEDICAALHIEPEQLLGSEEQAA
jgi:BetR domain